MNDQHAATPEVNREGWWTREHARVNDTIQATLFGTLVVAGVQGALGGLMFRWLGLPAPMLWGAGGLSLFGASGLVLGPLILALTDAILKIWRCRTAHGRPAEAAAAWVAQAAEESS